MRPSPGSTVNVSTRNVPAGTIAENVGFAIPATTAVPVIEELLATGEVRHAFLGIGGASLAPQVADRFGFDGTAGS